MTDDAKCFDLDSWEDFERELKDLRPILEGRKGLSPLFRGQGDSCWKLATTLERNVDSMILFKEYYRLIYTSRSEIENLAKKTWDISEYENIEKLVSDYDTFNGILRTGPKPAYAYMIYLRHHGFPSPLLDWTRSPRIAAYFAFRKEVEADRVAIYMICERNIKSYSNKMPAVYRLGQYVQNAPERHVFQQSDYTLSLIFNQMKEWEFAAHDDVFYPRGTVPGSAPNYDIWKFNIPSTERLKVLRILDEYNLNAFSLFRSTESLMETIAIRKLHF